MSASKPSPKFSRTFMSISLTDAHRSSPRSSRNLSQNPSCDHGPAQFPRIQNSPPGLSETLSRSSESGQISAPESVSGFCVRNSGTVAASTAAADFCGSSKRVIGSGTREARKDSYGQFQGTSLHYPSANQAVRVGSSNNGHPVPRSSPPQGNATHSAARKSQTMNANHLLNFHYDPISRSQPRVSKVPPRRQQKLKPYNKDLFLQANYKFVVLDVGGHTLQSTDPDKMLQWEDVICVRYSTPFPVQCPICLEIPLCPQITSCGHIFCFPCILRYLCMGVEDRKGDCWKKCPLCFMMISSKDLYTIYIDHVDHYRVGDRVNFTLLTRQKDSLIPSPKNQCTDCLCDIFSKFTLTTDVELSVREAKVALDDWLAKSESGQVDDLEKLPYVCAALEQLEQRKNCWIEHQALSCSPPLRNQTSYSNLKVCKCTLLSADNSEVGDPVAGTSFIGCKVESSESESVSTERIDREVDLVKPDLLESFESPEKVFFSSDEEKGMQRQSGSSKDLRENESYTFYQATDGQLLILHPLNMKCLLHHYGSHDLLPPRIGGEILQLETVTQSETMRKRYRYLSHFSLTTAFQLCEIDLSDVLPRDALAPFKDEIRKRESQRKHIAKKEHEQKAREEAAEFAAMHAQSIPSHLRCPSYNDTTFSMDDFKALGNSAIPFTSPPVVGERKLFSHVARLGFAAAHDSPSLTAEEHGDASSVLEVTGEASILTGPRDKPTLSFANIISSEPARAGGSENRKASGFGKKGKKASRVLLSTAGGRRY